MLLEDIELKFGVFQNSKQYNFAILVFNSKYFNLHLIEETHGSEYIYYKSKEWVYVIVLVRNIPSSIYQSFLVAEAVYSITDHKIVNLKCRHKSPPFIEALTHLVDGYYTAVYFDEETTNVNNKENILRAVNKQTLLYNLTKSESEDLYNLFVYFILVKQEGMDCNIYFNETLYSTIYRWNMVGENDINYFLCLLQTSYPEKIIEVIQ